MADQIGVGLSVSYCTTSNGSFVAIPKVTSVDIPDQAYGFDESTNMDSTYIERLKTLRDPDKMTVDSNYNETTFQALNAIIGTAYFWKVIFPDATYGVCAGTLVGSPSVTATPTKTMVMKSTIQLTGLFTFTTA